MQSIYMAVGGTNWGFNPAPFMYTSYDYGSPISEPGTLSFKYPELKLVGEMSQALPDLTRPTSSRRRDPGSDHVRGAQPGHRGDLPVPGQRWHIAGHDVAALAAERDRHRAGA